ncbi:MAG TPA: hypothetical protein VKU41_31305 [Polyangiaceae bacterium]|nr:hypothetical protein [Polyangiaceae bacterium]
MNLARQGRGVPPPVQSSAVHRRAHLTSALLLLLSSVSSACSSGDPSGSQGRQRPIPMKITEPTATQSSALLSGAVNVSQGIVSGSPLEKEVASVTLDYPPGTTYGVAAVFNALDDAHVDNNTNDLCKGYSYSAMSYDTNGAFRGLRIPTPSGIAMLNGDPAVAVATVPGYWVLWTLSLATSNAAWGTNQCLSVLAAPDEACLTAVAIPADGSAASILSQYTTCYPAQVGGLDGGSLFWSTATGNVYSAHYQQANPYTDNFGKIVVYKNGVFLGYPFGSTLFLGHAKFMQTGGFDSIPTVVAPDTNGYFWVARYDETGGTWTVNSVTSAPGAPFKWEEDTPIRGGTAVRGEQFAGDFYQEFKGGEDFMWMFYETKVSAYGTKRLQGVRCVFYGVNVIECDSPVGSLTPSGANAFMPSVAAVNVQGRQNDIGYRPWLSYWTDIGGGQVQMVMAKVSRMDGTLTTYPLQGITETPCPYEDDWGDYDSFTVWNNGSSQPTLLRYLTDTTAQACNGGASNHISVVFGNGAL